MRIPLVLCSVVSTGGASVFTTILSEASLALPSTTVRHVVHPSAPRFVSVVRRLSVPVRTFFVHFVSFWSCFLSCWRVISVCFVHCSGAQLRPEKHLCASRHHWPQASLLSRYGSKPTHQTTHRTSAQRYSRKRDARFPPYALFAAAC